jgi:hypothetical protein
MNSPKAPDLKFRYSIGFGDLIACFLHSKPIGWLTHLISGKDKPCTICNQRRQAWNIILPIKFWKLFFKDESDLLETLAAEYRAQGYKTKIENGKISVSKFTQVKD